MIENKIKVSIIVPVYNVENYIKKCLDSLVSQSLDNIEIILVNDASSDNSYEIMLEYEKKYEQIMCINLEKNMCQGGARNAGIDKSSGEYLLFVDSDDYVDDGICEKLYNKAVKTDSDMVFCNYLFVNEKDEALQEKMLYPFEYSGEVTIEKKRGFMSKSAWICGKLFRSSVWKQHNIRFPEYLKYEDPPAVTMFLMYCKKCDVVPDPMYYYVQRESSTTNIRNVGHHKDSLITTLMFVDNMKKDNLYECFVDEVERFMVDRYYVKFLKRCVGKYDHYPYDEMIEVRDFIKKEFPNYQKSKYYMSFTGEERMLMELNEINPKAAVLWNTMLEKKMTKDERKMLGILFYQDYYMQHIDKLNSLIGKLCLEEKTVGIWGAGLKRIALMDVIKTNMPDSNMVFLIKDENERLDEEECILEDEINRFDYILVVNPSFYLGIWRLVESKKDIVLLNLEDYLNGYIYLDI